MACKLGERLRAECKLKELGRLRLKRSHTAKDWRNSHRSWESANHVHARPCSVITETPTASGPGNTLERGKRRGRVFRRLNLNRSKWIAFHFYRRLPKPFYQITPTNQSVPDSHSFPSSSGLFSFFSGSSIKGPASGRWNGTPRDLQRPSTIHRDQSSISVSRPGGGGGAPPLPPPLSIARASQYNLISCV